MPDESSGLLSVRRRRGHSADLRHFVFAAFRPPANATQRSAAALCPHRGHGRQWRARFARFRADLSRKRCPCIAARSVPQTPQRARHAMSETPQIPYTLTDEAPWLASQSLLPVVQAYAAPAGIAVDTRALPLAARLLSPSPQPLPEDKTPPPDLARLGPLAKTPQPTIITLPN